MFFDDVDTMPTDGGAVTDAPTDETKEGGETESAM